ncbi:uncharacterized protein [Heptranchias perlo]|uniref:uncharacterized protein n=1 Tax=Heptranchias perlo TaxID=212740 RepID=UPI003559B9F2
MSFGDILETVGSVGKFQIIHIFLLAAPALIMPSHNLLQNFVAAVPDHHCRIRLEANGSRYDNVTDKLQTEKLLRVFIPLDQKQQLEKCRVYSSPQWHLLDLNKTQQNRTDYDTQMCTDGWTYDDSKFKATIVSEWDLVCNWKSLKRMAQSIYMAGLLTGAIVLGRLSDKFGRRTVLLWSYFQMAVSGTCGAFSSSFPLFCFWRFLCGIAGSGIILNSFSLKVEWIPTRVRTSVAMIGNYLYTFGQLLLAGLAYGIRDWRWLQLTVSIPYFAFFLSAWWFPESARWLILNDKADVALKQLKRVARLNGKEEEGEKLTTAILKSNMENELSDTKNKYSVLDLFRTPVMRKIACCTMLVWFSTSFAYYGLAIDLQGFGVDIYLIQLIFGAVDIPAKCLAFVSLNLIGRRFTQSSSLILAGSIIIANIFVPKEMQTLRTSFAAIGKGCLSAAFNCCYLHAGELYPTVVRQTGMGLVSTMARVGSMVAPIIRMLGDYIPFLPMAAYGGIAIIAGVAAFFLLETLDVPLPDTVMEVESRAKKGAVKEQEPKRDEIPLQETHISLMKQTVLHLWSADMGFADILETVGSVGKFQIIHILLMIFPILIMPSHNLLQNFVAAVPNHHCRIRLGANGSRYDNVTGKLQTEKLLRVFIPLDQKQQPEKCRVYSSPQWHLLDLNKTEQNRNDYDTQMCTDGWTYDNSKFKATVVTEWDLVCSQKSLKRMAQSIYMAGLLTGAIVLGRLSDKYGRRTLLLWSSFQMAVSGTCGAFSSSFPLFCFWRFLCGMAMSGVIFNTYYFAVEWIPTRIRTSVITVMNYAYTLGQLVLAGLAYGIRDWRWLQFAVSTPFFIIFLYTWWFPESARWLILNNKTDVALKQLKRVAKLNGKEAEGEKLTTAILKSSMEKELSNIKDTYSMIDLFRTPVMRKTACCTMLVWFSTSLAYYGLSIDLQGFGVDVYLIQVIFGAVDIPAKLVGVITMSYIGRRFTQGTSLILAGGIIITNIFIPKELQTVRTSFAAVGKGCLATAFSCCYLHAGELYPTVVRQTGMGLVSTMARVGAMVAPVVRLIGDYVPFLPMATYGGMAIISGVAAFFLLETLNVPLPDTIEEVESRVKKGAEKEKEPKADEIPLQKTQISLMKQTV